MKELFNHWSLVVWININNCQDDIMSEHIVILILSTVSGMRAEG